MNGQDWKPLVLRDPYGPLLATKGLDPTLFSYHSTLRDAIKIGLSRNKDVVQLVREVKRRLRRREYDSDVLDCIIQGVRATDEEIWAFVQLWTMFGECQIASLGFEMPDEPPEDIRLAARALEDVFRGTFAGIDIEVHLFENGRTRRRGIDGVILRGVLPIQTPVRNDDGDLIDVDTVVLNEVRAYFIPGPCSALYFYEQMVEHHALFRWPAGQRRAVLYAPREDRIRKRSL